MGIVSCEVISSQMQVAENYKEGLYSECLNIHSCFSARCVVKSSSVWSKVNSGG